MRGRRAIALGLILTLLIALFPAIPTEAAVKINKKSVMVMAGKTVKLKVSGTKKNVTWKSSKKSVATVSKNGKVKAKKPGATVITAKAGKKTAKCNVVVTDKVNINNYVVNGIFDYAGYGAAKGAEVRLGKDNGNISQVGFFFDSWYVEVSTNYSPGVAIDGVGFIAVGAPSSYTLTYAVDLPFGTGVSIGNGLSIPDNSLDPLDKFIDYMKAHPDPNTKPEIDGLTVVPW